jgi:aspartyl-tRNA(Asn)/glutamyl-tRNA(Gln) amidotransferase subunit C
MAEILSSEEIKSIAFTARLGLTTKEEECLVRDLNELLENAKQLDEVDTDSVEPTIYNMPVLREVFFDGARQKSLDMSAILVNTTQVEDGAFKVPKVFE